jgi:hypothetical protein
MPCYCPDDCNCHHPHRTNYCGCGAHHKPDEPCASPMGAVRGCWPLKPCIRCGQMSDAASVCASCRSGEREPQGEAVRLFEPAPSQIPGQLGF